MKQQINNNSGINEAKFSFSYLGKYVETNLGNKGIIVEEYLCYPEPSEWVLDNGYILNEALMYEENEEFVVIKNLKKNDLNMKSARELFEELGWYLDIETNDNQIVYSKNKFNNDTFGFIGAKAITFDKEMESVYLDEVDDISMILLQAINQQVNELGWK